MTCLGSLYGKSVGLKIPRCRFKSDPRQVRVDEERCKSVSFSGQQPVADSGFDRRVRDDEWSGELVSREFGVWSSIGAIIDDHRNRDVATRHSARREL